MSTHRHNNDDKQLTITEFDARNDWISIRVRDEMNAEIAVSALR